MANRNEVLNKPEVSRDTKAMLRNKYILWDWNGTLLDDTRAAFNTLNIMLKKRGVKPIAMEFYLDNFAFPVKPFYESIGMVLDNENWDDLAIEYHDIYAAQNKVLNVEAIAALEKVRLCGVGQSIISALRQDLLRKATDSFGVSKYLDYVYGVDNLDGCSKIERAKELLDKIRGEHVEELDIVLIGDSLHDKEVADMLGVGCVLCSQGSHAHWRLEKVAPTCRDLLSAVECAI
jgi:phosphoglycolate phosphatase